jgi:hypothetical protein
LRRFARRNVEKFRETAQKQGRRYYTTESVCRATAVSIPRFLAVFIVPFRRRGRMVPNSAKLHLHLGQNATAWRCSSPNSSINARYSACSFGTGYAKGSDEK